jgi:hypothetical protein
MNELINWVALNNTLMIRIGFSAVLLLVIAYVFRYFFVPRISVVTQAEEAAAAEEALAVKDRKESSDLVAAEEQARTEEIESLKSEIISLKAQIQDLPAAVAAKVPGAAGAAAATAPAAPSAATAQAAVNVNENELVTKVQSLEARLAEYEIIADEIAEISLLREENAALKAQLAAGVPAAAAAAPAEPAPLAEPAPEAAAPAEETKYDGYEILPPPAAEESRLVITSEVEVSEDEQALLNDFEEMIRKKG